jgi:hypothetical protein
METAEEDEASKEDYEEIKVPPGMKGKKLTPDEEKYLGLVRELTDGATIMVVKVACCECPNKEGCEVFEQGRHIAKTVNQIQSIRGVGAAFGKGRRKVRA